MAQQLHQGSLRVHMCGQIKYSMSFIPVKCVKLHVYVCVFYEAHLCQFLSLLSSHHPVMCGVSLEHTMDRQYPVRNCGSFPKVLSHSVWRVINANEGIHSRVGHIAYLYFKLSTLTA